MRNSHKRRGDDIAQISFLVPSRSEACTQMGDSGSACHCYPDLRSGSRVRCEFHALGGLDRRNLSGVSLGSLLPSGTGGEGTRSRVPAYEGSRSTGGLAKALDCLNIRNRPGARTPRPFLFILFLPSFFDSLVKLCICKGWWLERRQSSPRRLPPNNDEVLQFVSIMSARLAQVVRARH